MDAYTTILVFILLALSGMAMSKLIHNPETVRGKTIVEDIALLRKQVTVQSKELASQRKIIEKLENIVIKLVENDGMNLTNIGEDTDIKLKIRETRFSRSASYHNSSFEDVTENDILNGDLDGEENSRQNRLAISDAQVGFTAFLHSSILVSSGNAIIFNYVISNVGSAYSQHNGIFITKQPGLYAFYIDIECAPHTKDIYIEIVKDGTRIADTYCQGDDLFDNSGTMSVVHLNIGDAVWVRPYQTTGSISLGGKSSFSGFLTGYVTGRP
ncbi:unnamed protein product [Mytilus coruscus]|uniref:C1q domain-containing protein n=1 Tax=Mytilus coruscus TaxID=42192 RepID=A0A6J8DBT3_MYTCO|nr:unnamed protein product [Mytilus coruscus]